LFYWNHRNRVEYVSVLGLPGPTDNVHELLARVCATNSFFLPSDRNQPWRHPSWSATEIESLSDSKLRTLPRPDVKRAAAHVLRMFNKGAMGRATFLPSDEEAASMDTVPLEQLNQADKDPLNIDLGDPPEEWSKWFAYMGLKTVELISRYESLPAGID
uniref:Rubis-subs-bind domain-containing protein n=1 Tax=Echinostoma caproni TaxID=27848 RepID=A0A183B648_9TREM